MEMLSSVAQQGNLQYSHGRDCIIVRRDPNANGYIYPQKVGTAHFGSISNSPNVGFVQLRRRSKYGLSLAASFIWISENPIVPVEQNHFVHLVGFDAIRGQCVYSVDRNKLEISDVTLNVMLITNKGVNKKERFAEGCLGATVSITTFDGKDVEIFVYCGVTSSFARLSASGIADNIPLFFFKPGTNNPSFKHRTHIWRRYDE